MVKKCCHFHLRQPQLMHFLLAFCTFYHMLLWSVWCNLWCLVLGITKHSFHLRFDIMRFECFVYDSKLWSGIWFEICPLIPRHFSDMSNTAERWLLFVWNFRRFIFHETEKKIGEKTWTPQFWKLCWRSYQANFPFR